MDERVKGYYKKNYLYAGHRMIVPETSEKFRNSCNSCKYFVTVIGQTENKRVCLLAVKAFQRGSKRVPESIQILDLILLLGKESLQNILANTGPHQSACGSFEQKQ